MAFNINDFRAALRFGGGRNSLFQVKLTNPVNGAADTILPFMCRTASLPQRQVTSIQVGYFGRMVKVAGTVQNYDDWQVTIINDEDHKIRNAIEEWSHAINAPAGNIRLLPGSEPSLYKSTAEVTHYSQTGRVLREYKFVGLWPTAISEIPLDWQQDGITEFSVSFSVDYWTLSGNSTTGFAGGINI